MKYSELPRLTLAGEGRVVGVPKFHSWGKCTMPLTNINSDWISNATSALCIILCYLYYIIEQSNRTSRCSREVSAAGLPWLDHFRLQCYTQVKFFLVGFKESAT